MNADNPDNTWDDGCYVQDVKKDVLSLRRGTEEMKRTTKIKQSLIWPAYLNVSSYAHFTAHNGGSANTTKTIQNFALFYLFPRMLTTYDGGRGC